MNDDGQNRRDLLKRLLVGGGAVAVAGAVQAEGDDKPLRFPGDPTDHKIVYQFNKGDADYHKAVLFSVGEMVRTYGDNITIVVSCFGPGIHILAKKPGRPVADEIKERVSSLSAYGVQFHACGNTLKALHWTEKDIVDFAKVVEVGAADIMELQEQGFSYISW